MSRNKRRPMTRMLIYVGIFFAIVFGWYGARKIMFFWFFSHYKLPAVTIAATDVETKSWQSYLSAVGTLSAINGVDITAEVAGIVDEIPIQSGQIVKKGDPIVILRHDVEAAYLKSNKARLQLAQMNYDREKKLYEKHAASQAQLDTSYAELMDAQGRVESVDAQLKQKTITAPFAGKLGIKQMNVGQFVAPNTFLITLQSLNPLYVNFNVPEQYLPNLALGQDIDVNIGLNQTETVVKGKITAINSKIDQATRNVLVEATISNEQNQLFPGMYAFVKVWLTSKPNTIVVPQTAVSYSLSGDYVFIIKDETNESTLTAKTKEDQKLSQNQSQHQNHDQNQNLQVYRQYVKVGERRGDEVVITDGLKAGDRIVTAGQLKLQNGTHVFIDNQVKL